MLMISSGYDTQELALAIEAEMVKNVNIRTTYDAFLPEIQMIHE